MTTEPLATAARSLREASDAADDDEVAERLASQADQFERHADGDSSPDHGRLARHEHILSSISDDEGDTEAAEHVGEALAAIRSYRETVEGV
ncbi:hypothetical protein OB955_04675 [Halobacteria archaeon AArc-m2/3/4]|uniref:Uncharacterized protein n=1 Tax=Natronoglomus mannanivorans TaxID=2979990 RepID=A0AAP2Z0I2_9EURY|nr:hypothetical protein [Halobacteria archaeon AArc-xg1-1]MCU4972028.1 hypothetical protein [Halobacteria archaeon AArc-m2/3/4]